MKSVTEILTIKLYYIDYKTPQKQASPVGVIAPDGANEVLFNDKASGPYLHVNSQ